jgi:outer membrane protein assembly factor BamA
VSHRSPHLAAFLLAGCLSFCVAGVARSAAPPRQVYVGQIIVVGNERTSQSVILRQLPFNSASVLSYDALREAETNLARLGIFEVSDEVRPTVRVLDNPNDPESEFKDVLVTVQEAATGMLAWGIGVDCEDGLFLSVVLSERNLDVTRFPTSLDDLGSGNAFRGAGQEFRAELRLGTQMPRLDVTFRDPALSEKATSLAGLVKDCLAEWWQNKPSEPIDRESPP